MRISTRREYDLGSSKIIALKMPPKIPMTLFPPIGGTIKIALSLLVNLVLKAEKKNLVKTF